MEFQDSDHVYDPMNPDYRLLVKAAPWIFSGRTENFSNTKCDVSTNYLESSSIKTMTDETTRESVEINTTVSEDDESSAQYDSVVDLGFTVPPAEIGLLNMMSMSFRRMWSMEDPFRKSKMGQYVSVDNEEKSNNVSFADDEDEDAATDESSLSSESSQRGKSRRRALTIGDTIDFMSSMAFSATRSITTIASVVGGRGASIEGDHLIDSETSTWRKFLNILTEWGDFTLKIGNYSNLAFVGNSRGWNMAQPWLMGDIGNGSIRARDTLSFRPVF